MIADRQLVAALTTGGANDALIRYACQIARLNGRASRIASTTATPRHDPEPLEEGGAAPLATVPVATDDGPAVVLSASEATRFVEAPARGGARRLLAIAAEESTDALLIGDSRLARDLVRRAACPVWFVPDRTSPTPRRILVPVDFSARAADSLRVATALARLSGAACVALHVFFNESVHAGPAQARKRRQELADEFARFVAPIDLLGVSVTPRFEEAADLPRAVRRAAQEQSADLIVMASRGRGWLGGWLRPSLAEQTLRGCPLPLLVVKHFGARRKLADLLRDPAFQRRNDTRFN